MSALRSSPMDPESTFAQGPVLEILRNVLNSLDCCEVDMRIGPERGPCLINKSAWQAHYDCSTAHAKSAIGSLDLDGPLAL